MALAQVLDIDAVRDRVVPLLQELEARRVSVIAINGMAFDVSTPHGRIVGTVLGGIAEFERVEQVR